MGIPTGFKVAAIPKAAYKVGDFSDEMNKLFDCSFQKVNDVNVNLSVGDNDCITYQAGIEWPGIGVPEGVEVGSVVKIKYHGQLFYINQNSYKALLDACNNCCIE